MKKFLSLVLALAMVFSLAACGGSPAANSNPPADNSIAPSEDVGEPAAFTPVTYDYETLYNETLGEFYDLYMKAKEAGNVSERWIYLAVSVQIHFPDAVADVLSGKIPADGRGVGARRRTRIFHPGKKRASAPSGIGKIGKHNPVAPAAQRGFNDPAVPCIYADMSGKRQNRPNRQIFRNFPRFSA